MNVRRTPAERVIDAVQELDALIDWERRERVAMRVSTEPARRLLERLGDPQLSYRVVHVTGSKGKGTTASLVAAGLQRAGLRVGRYGSPHVERIHERVVIDGAEVSDERIADGLEHALAARADLIAADREVPTWFDVLTAAALWIFREEAVDWVVAEVGLGGRLDSTNVLHGEVCIVTNIELEHTAVLGTHRSAIAWEKAGILKPGCTAVTGLGASDEAGRVVQRVADGLGVKVLRPEWVESGTPRSISEMNRSMAALALDELGRLGVRGRDGRPPSGSLLDPATIRAAQLPARLERFECEGIPVVLDGAHTPGSVSAALADLSCDRSLPGRPVVVLGLARDKDAAGILKALGSAAEKVFCTSVGTDLHRTPQELASVALELGLGTETASPPRVAFDRALACARGRWVLVIGSLYLAGFLRPHLRQAVP